MGDYEITCICGRSYRVNPDESVTCPCGAKLNVQPLHQKIEGVWRKFYQPVASIDEDSAEERKQAGKAVKQDAPSLRHVGRVR